MLSKFIFSDMARDKFSAIAEKGDIPEFKADDIIFLGG